MLCAHTSGLTEDERAGARDQGRRQGSQAGPTFEKPEQASSLKHLVCTAPAPGLGKTSLRGPRARGHVPCRPVTLLLTPTFPWGSLHLPGSVRKCKCTPCPAPPSPQQHGTNVTSRPTSSSTCVLSPGPSQETLRRQAAVRGTRDSRPRVTCLPRMPQASHESGGGRKLCPAA